MNSLKKTKIVCTIGPASWDEENLRKLILAGMNVARLNFSHGNYATHLQTIKTVRKLSKELNTPIMILQDLQGPKIRVGTLKEGELRLDPGKEVTLAHLDVAEKEGVDIPIQFDFVPYIKVGDPIFLNDAYMKLEVTKKSGKVLTAKVVDGGILLSNKGINIPETLLPDVAITQKDKEDTEFGIENGVDYVGISFVQTVNDIKTIRAIIEKKKSDAKVLVKVELKSAVENLEEIIEETDAVMVARGDMAIEVGLTEVPIVQKKAIELCKKYQKPVIVATQMLESMITNPRPTRAEVNDVANAVFDQVDAVMLSAESASGNYPVEAVETMSNIIKRIEKVISREDYLPLGQIFREAKQTQAIAMAASILAEKIQADAIVVATASGNIARALSSYRTPIPVFAVTDSEHVYSQLALNWGVKSFLRNKVKSAQEFVDKAIDDITKRGMLKKGDRVVIACGTHTGIPDATHMIQVHTIE